MEEFLYRAFCTVLFILAVSLLFVLVGRQSLLIEKAEEASAGTGRPESVLHAGMIGIKTPEHTTRVTGWELLQLFYDPLPEKVELDGVLLRKGELYDGSGYIQPDLYYEKELIYARGETERIIFTAVRQREAAFTAGGGPAARRMSGRKK